MVRAMQPGGRSGGPSPTGLADVIETILDKGMVIDAYVRVSLVGIEVLTIDARIVIASVDTYLRFAEAVNRLDIANDGTAMGLPELGQKMNGGGQRRYRIVRGARGDPHKGRYSIFSGPGGMPRLSEVMPIWS